MGINGKTLEENFDLLVNELKLFHWYHLEVYVRKWIYVYSL